MLCTKYFLAMTTLPINAEALQTPSELRHLKVLIPASAGKRHCNPFGSRFLFIDNKRKEEPPATIQDLREKPLLVQPSLFSPQGSQPVIKAGSEIHIRLKMGARLTQAQIILYISCLKSLSGEEWHNIHCKSQAQVKLENVSSILPDQWIAEHLGHITKDRLICQHRPPQQPQSTEAQMLVSLDRQAAWQTHKEWRQLMNTEFFMSKFTHTHPFHF